LCPKSGRLWCDNMDAKYLASNPIFHGRMIHVEVYYHFIRDRVAKKLLEVDLSRQMTKWLMASLNRYLKEDHSSFNVI
jgi:hypothetical protein